MSNFGRLFRLHEELSVYDGDDVESNSLEEQMAVELSCKRCYDKFLDALTVDNAEGPTLKRAATVKFLERGIETLSFGYECLDASRPWLVYWILHALELLKVKLDLKRRKRIVDFLGRCQNKDGGFGGGPGQMSHLAPSYAAVNALAILGGDSGAFHVVDRAALVKWMNSLRNPADGSFVMHEDGEVDIRGVYCALSVARLLNIYTEALFEKTAEWTLACQTYEGGFGGEPGMEAHGGYTFCGLAALVLLGQERRCRLDRLLRWAVNRQMRLEGGFQGRTNKLVDGCYSFWQGGLFPLLHKMLEESGRKPPCWLFNRTALQEYLLICAQDPRGGLVDKPGKSRDFYNTSYTLSGLSVAQHFESSDPLVVGPRSKNQTEPIHPIYNVGMNAAFECEQHFANKSTPSPSD